MRYIFFFPALMIFCTCNNPASSEYSPEIDPNKAAIPHGDTLSIVELSDEDQAKLASAKGKEAKKIKFDQLQAMIKRPENQLFIYNFWKLDCQECLSLNSELKKLESTEKPGRLKLVLVNLDLESSTSEVNTYIRSQNVLSEVLQLSIPFDQENWHQQLINAWDGQLPATLFLRTGDGIDLFYQYPFKSDELQAIVQPLLL